MFKKNILGILLLISMMSSTVMAKNEPIVAPGDADTIAANIKQIATNLWDATQNTARIGVRAAVDVSNGLVTVSKYLSDHPKFTTAAFLMSGYCYYQYRKECDRARARFGDDFTLLDLWRTTTERWTRTPRACSS